MREAEAAAERMSGEPRALYLDIRNTSPKGQGAGNRTGEWPRRDILSDRVYSPLPPLAAGGRKATGLRPMGYDRRATEEDPRRSLQPVASMLKAAG